VEILPKKLLMDYQLIFPDILAIPKNKKNLEDNKTSKIPVKYVSKSN